MAAKCRTFVTDSKLDWPIQRPGVLHTLKSFPINCGSLEENNFMAIVTSLMSSLNHLFDVLSERERFICSDSQMFILRYFRHCYAAE